jgi:hypothetical protein
MPERGELGLDPAVDEELGAVDVDDRHPPEGSRARE